MRNTGFGDLESLRNVSGSQILSLQQVQNLSARLIIECFENFVHSVFKYLDKYLNINLKIEIILEKLFLLVQLDLQCFLNFSSRNKNDQYM